MKKIVLTVLALVYTLSACTDLDINPNSKLTDGNVYKTKEEFLYGLSGVYGTTGVWSELVFKIGSATDEMIFPARGADWKGDLQAFQTHTWRPDNGEINGAYSGLSKSIAVANAFIEAVDKSKFSNDADILVIKGEARFVRAFDYFLMMDLFGNVPLVTSSKYDSKNPPKQNTRAQLYDFVETELKALSENDLPMTAEYGRVDRFAAKALLAKLYLNADVYMGAGIQSQKVIDLTTDIMANSSFKLEDNYKNVFAWNNDQYKETLFAMVCASENTAAENISYLFSLNDMRAKYGPFAAGWGGAATLPTFYRSYEATDVRREAFVAGPQFGSDGAPIMMKDDAGVTRQLTFNIDFLGTDPVLNADHWDGPRGVKYLMDGIGGPMTKRGLNNDMPILRFADVMLMRAEALWRQNAGSTEALNLVNTVRTRNGNNPIPVLTTLTEDNLLAERGREFAWEGWRRNDLIRFGRWGNAWDYKAVSDAKYKLFPIPQTQIDSNPNLAQNPAYK